jgi:hypothetical protein
MLHLRVKVKVKISLYRPELSLRAPRSLRFQEFLETWNMKVARCQLYVPVAFTPWDIHLVLISVRG